MDTLINIYKNNFGKKFLPNNKRQPWIILGDLNELSNPYEKLQLVMVVARDIIYSTILVVPIILLIYVLCIILLHGIINIKTRIPFILG